MLLIFFLCINLSILHVCVSDLGYTCKRDEVHMDLSNFRNVIYLTSPRDAVNDKERAIIGQLNRKFAEKCQDFYTILPPHRFDDRLSKFLEDRNHIELYVSNYTLTDTDESEEKIVYAGDLFDTVDPHIYDKSNRTEREYDDDKKRTVKLVTKSVKEINYGDLFDFVTKIQITNGEIYTRDSCYSVIEKPKELKTVLLCMNTYMFQDIWLNIEHLKLEVATIDDCQRYIEKFNNNYLAVLTPKPFEIESENSIPTIFYDIPYMFPEYTTYFPNSMNLVPWQMLKYSFTQFLKQIGWSRVVIISDDSVYSIDFENELAALFSAEKIMYTVIRCEDAVFDVSKTINTLYKIGASIVIANVGEKNQYDLITRTANKYVWLVRDFADFNYRKHVYSFSVDPAVRHSEECNFNNRILEGISIIAQAYRKMTHKDFALSKRQFYRNFAQAMKSTRKNEVMAYVKRVPNQETLLSMHIDESGFKDVQFNDPYKNIAKPRDAATCLVQGNTYEEPCDDILVLVFMFIILMFTTTLLLISCFFHKTSPIHDIRYQNF